MLESRKKLTTKTALSYLSAYELAKQLIEKNYDPRYKRGLLREKKEVFATLKIDDMSPKGLSLMVDRILQTANNRMNTL